MASEYRLKIYSKVGVLDSVIFNNDFELRRFENTINKAGKALFVLPKSASKAVKATFQKQKRVKIFRYSDNTSQFEPVWSGYIEQVDEVEDAFEVGCVGLLDIFEKRLTGSDQAISGANGGTEALDLLDDTNADDDTGIGRGATDYSNAVDMIADRKPLLSVWEDIAEAEGGEFQIDVETDELNFYSALGTDKSATLQFVYDEYLPEKNNIRFSKIQETGKEIYTRIIGIAKKSDGTELTSIQEDSPAIAKYGLLEKVESFDEVESQTQLDDLTTGLLAQLKEEIDNPDVRILEKQTRTNILGTEQTIGIDLEDIVVGDIVSLRYKTSYNEIEEDRRIVSIAVEVGTGGNEDISIKLNKEEQNLEIISTLQQSAQSKRDRRIQQDLVRRVYRT